MTDGSNYDATKIEALTAVEAVRRRPAMYVGDMQDATLPARLLMQALCHAADCAMDGECSRVGIRIDGHDVEVEYDAGMPIDPEAGDADQAPLIFLSVLSGCHNRKRHLEVGDELCETGLMVLNALSDRMTVTTSFSGWSARYCFIKGTLVERAPMTPDERNDRTSISFRLDHEILKDNTQFDREFLDKKIKGIQCILPRMDVSIFSAT
jgi:DNA gyrase subunit B